MYRPDELANRAEIERDEKKRSNISKALAASSTLGTSMLYGQTALKILPYLAEGTPINIAIKGLEKISPKMANFVKRGMKMGLKAEDGLEFIKENLGQQVEEKPKGLFERLLGDIDIDTLDEGTQKQLRFLSPIAQQLEKSGKDEKDPAVKKLRNKIKKVLGGKIGFLQKQAMELDPNTQPMQPQQQAPQPAQMSQPPQPQDGQGQEALLAILQKIQAMRGGGG